MPIISWCRLSAHLFELTADPKYLASAEAAANFVSSHMYNGQAIKDTIRLSFNSSSPDTNCTVANPSFYSYITGFTIWGFSVLATHNGSYTSL